MPATSRTAITARPTTASYTPPTSRIEDMKPRALPDQKVLHKQMSDMMARFTKHSAARVQLYRPEAASPVMTQQEQEKSYNPMITRRLTNETGSENNASSATMLFNFKNRNEK